VVNAPAALPCPFASALRGGCGRRPTYRALLASVARFLQQGRKVTAAERFHARGAAQRFFERPVADNQPAHADAPELVLGSLGEVTPVLEHFGWRHALNVCVGKSEERLDRAVVGEFVSQLECWA
jgi:hypothetical protein